MKASLFTLSALVLAVQGAMVKIDKRSQTYTMSCSISIARTPISEYIGVQLRYSGGYNQGKSVWADSNQPRVCSDDGGFCVKLGRNKDCCNYVYLTINGITKEPSSRENISTRNDHICVYRGSLSEFGM
ncbi:hypothetical protein BKA57DRAFT_537616, partial [Linnemannia elongata]